MTPRSRPFARACTGAVVVCLFVSACSGSSHPKAKPRPTPKTGAASHAATRVSHPLKVGSVTVQHAGRVVPFADGTKRKVLAIAQHYVDKGILAPLENGRVAKGYAKLFAPGIRPAAITTDERVLTDLPVGTTTKLVEHAGPVAMSALTDTTGALLYVATKFNVTVQATRKAGAITVTRKVELTFEKIDGWRIVAYRVTVTRYAPLPAKTTPKKSKPTTPKKSTKGSKP
jgi:hypothetical protein